MLFAAWAALTAYKYALWAEAHIDPEHWAGVSVNDPMNSIIQRAWRFNTGKGYTPVGRKIWWDGYKYLFIVFAVGVTAQPGYLLFAALC